MQYPRDVQTSAGPETVNSSARYRATFASFASATDLLDYNGCGQVRFRVTAPRDQDLGFNAKRARGRREAVLNIRPVYGTRQQDRLYTWKRRERHPFEWTRARAAKL
jgi:hypothetical protein